MGFIRANKNLSIGTLLFVLAIVSFSLSHPTAGQSPLDEAKALNTKAIELYRAGNAGEAIALAQRALTLLEQSLGPDHPEVSTALSKLAWLYRAQGQYAEAEPLYKRSLSIKEKSLGPDHPEIGTTLSNLALLYRAQGRYAEAEPLYKRARAIRDKQLELERARRRLADEERQKLERAQRRLAVEERQKLEIRQQEERQKLERTQRRLAVEAGHKLEIRRQRTARLRELELERARRRLAVEERHKLEIRRQRTARLREPKLERARRRLAVEERHKLEIRQQRTARLLHRLQNQRWLEQDPCENRTKCTPVSVFFGTDRARKDTNRRIGFGKDRADKLQLGRAVVTVPKRRKRGEIPRPNWLLSWLKKTALGRKAHGSVTKHFTIPPNGIVVYSSEYAFIQAVQQHMASAGEFKDHAFIFIHGYYTSFENAVYRTAQITYDLGLNNEPFGTSFLYSWPSAGTLEDYFYDTESASFTVSVREPFSLSLADYSAMATGHRSG